MKKILIIVLVLLLVGCRKTSVKPLVKPKEVVKEIEVEKVVEVDYIDTDQLRALMVLTNGETRKIELDVLHEQLSSQLLKEVDLNIDIDAQSDLIEDIVYDELDKWRLEIVRNILDQEQVILNDDDFDTLVSRTSINDAFQLMLSYETIFLKNEVE